MEWTIFAALEWKLHPPTQYSFIHHLILFLPLEVNSAVRKSLMEQANYLTELAVCDSYFVEAHSSTLAFASILNVMEDMSYSKLSGGLREKFFSTLACRVGLHPRSEDVVNARHRLRKVFATSYTTNTNSTVAPPPEAQRGQDNYGDNSSLADRSMSSTGSTRSYQTKSVNSCRSRANSFDSKGSCRYSPSPLVRFHASVSPLVSSRAAISSSPFVAGFH